MTFDEWWARLNTKDLPNVQRYRVVCKMAYTEGQKHGLPSMASVHSPEARPVVDVRKLAVEAVCGSRPSPHPSKEPVTVLEINMAKLLEDFGRKVLDACGLPQSLHQGEDK